MIQESRNIAIHNFDDHYRRFGIATLAWSAVSPCSAEALKSLHVSLTSGTGKEFYAQVDAIDPEDRSLDVLSIYGEWLKGGGVHEGLPVCELRLDFEVDDRTYTSQEIAAHRKARAASVARTPDYFLRMDPTGHVGAFIYLPAHPYGWQGGAITSIQVDGKEILDAPAAERGAHGHDLEKRLQLDRVFIANPPWATSPVVERHLYKNSWTFVAAGAGPVRAWVNIRSPKFSFEYADENGRKTTFDCHLYRVISAFRRADYLVEDLYVKGSLPGSTSTVRLNFGAHYFLKMQFGDDRRISQVPLIPDWFAIGTDEAPRPGFGFASTAPCVRIDHPPPDYLNRDGMKAAFSWQLDYAYSVRCVHLFRRWTYPNELENETGRTWFELIYRPLKARVV
jgi:hypothetical protein